MRLRTSTTVGLVGALLAGGVAAPAALGATKPKPKPIVGSYEATATPDPTPLAGEICQPTVPTARFTKEVTVPAKGTLFVDIDNTLDWAVAVRDAVGDTLASDDATPPAKESISVSFKKKQKVLIDACNFAGEPLVTVKYKFVYK